MADNTLALQVQPTQFGNNFAAGYNNGIDQQAARRQQEAAAFEQLATVGLGVMGGKLDGEIDPAKLEQALGMLHGNPLAEKVKENPELLRTITKGSLNVLQNARDGERFEMEKKKFELDLAKAQEPKAPPAPVEVSAGATMWDPTTKQPLYTAPTADKSKAPEIVTIYKGGKDQKGYMGPVDEKHPDGFYPVGDTKADDPAKPVDTFGNEKDLFQQYSNSDPVKTYETVKTSYERLKNSAEEQSGAGDMGMLYAYMKMLDPGSVVRESEFAAAAQSGDLGEQLQGAVSKLLNGQRLPESQRQEFLKNAEGLYRESASNLSDINSQFEERAKGAGVDPKRFIRQPETYKPAGKGDVTDWTDYFD